jgi:hypothetical protein
MEPVIQKWGIMRHSKLKRMTFQKEGTMRGRRSNVVVALAVLMALTCPLIAGEKGQEPGEVYLEYRETFEKAETLEEILPYFCKERAEEVKATPADEAAMMWDLMKMMMGGVSGLKVLDETWEGEDKVILKMEGIQTQEGETSKLTGEVIMLKEYGAWKIGIEKFSSSVS